MRKKYQSVRKILLLFKSWWES